MVQDRALTRPTTWQALLLHVLCAAVRRLHFFSLQAGRGKKGGVIHNLRKASKQAASSGPKRAPSTALLHDGSGPCGMQTSPEGR